MTYPLVNRTLADDPVEHLADHTAQVEFYNMMMAHMDGSRATPFFVNVQHPEFGATGRDNNALDESTELNAASLFASRDGGGVRRGLWLPATNVDGDRARYYVDTPFRTYTGVTVWGDGARVAASPRFDFITKFPTENTGWTDVEQGIMEGYNITPSNPIGRLKLGRYNVQGLLIEGMDIAGSIGAIFNMQQQSTWKGVRINDFTRCGLMLCGQQGIFHDFMVTGVNPDFGPSATYPIVGIHLGMPEYVGTNSPASFFWFYGTNVESCYRGVWQVRGSGANVFRDMHFEGVDSNSSGDPAYCFYLERGQLVVDQAAWFLAPTNNYGTFFHSQKASGATTPTAKISDVFISGGSPPGDNPIFVNDVDRGHLIKAWGDTRKSAGVEGIVRHISSYILGNLADGVYPRPHVNTIAHDEGGYTAFGTYNAAVVDAEQLPLLRMRPGATQMGHLVSWYDKAGVERFLVTADGVPKLPGYTSATKPAAAGRQTVMIYDLDTNKVQVSDGSAWVNLH